MDWETEQKRSMSYFNQTTELEKERDQVSESRHVSVLVSTSHPASPICASASCTRKHCESHRPSISP